MKKLLFAALFSACLAFDLVGQAQADDKVEKPGPAIANDKNEEIRGLLRGGVDPFASLALISPKPAAGGKVVVWFTAAKFSSRNEIQLEGRGINVEAVNSCIGNLLKTGVAEIRRQKKMALRDGGITFSAELVLKAKPPVANLPAAKEWQLFKERFEGKGHGRRQFTDLTSKLAKAASPSHAWRELNSMKRDRYLIHGNHITLKKAKWETIHGFVESIRKESPRAFFSEVEIRPRYRLNELTDFEAVFEVRCVEISE